MPITIHLVRLQQLRSLQAGSTQVDGFRVVPGSLPPAYLIRSAIENLKQFGNPMWHSFFLFIDPAGRHAIGSGNFHGAPENGRAEIGYEIAPPYRRQGFATEAARLLVELALKQPRVTEVCAETSIDNIASRRVLEKVGFRHVGKRERGGYGLVDQWLIRPQESEAPNPEDSQK